MGFQEVTEKVILKIDTREQKPLEFRDGIFDEIVVAGFPTGDYWCEINGSEVPLCYERKSLGDLYSTMTSGYPRFKKEMERAKEAGLKLVLLIEGSMREVAAGYEYSQYSGDAMMKKLAMLYVKYDLEYHFGDRRELARRIEETFTAVARHWRATK